MERPTTTPGGGSAAGVIGDAADGAVSLERGVRLGRYLVLDQLGEGGMSVVYSAYDPELHRKVAIKLLHQTAGGASPHLRLLREAQALAQLNHPHVVHVYDVGTVGDDVFLVQEILEGGTLRQWLRERPRSWREILDVFRRLGEGLAAAHAAGLVHRDVKPENILFDRVGRVRVTDFGLVRATGVDGPEPAEEGGTASALDAPLTRPGGALGTPQYMSPEQRAGAQVDARSDQYSFCVTLHEALHGALPGTSAPATRIPSRAQRALQRGLAAEPAARFPDMAALLAALAVAPRRRWGIAAAALALAGAVGVVSWADRRDPALCTGGERKVAGLWDAPRREAARAAFVATGRPYALRSWESASAALDAWSGTFASMHDDACAATRVRGEQSEDVLDRRMACLERKRQEAAMLVALFEKADTQVVDRAAGAASRVAPLADCADLSALLAPLPPPPAGSAARVAEVQRQVAEARTLASAGRPRDALARAEAAAAAARQIGYAPVEAEATLELGRRLMDSGDKAEPVLFESLWAAERSHADAGTAAALVRLTSVVGSQPGRRDEGLRLARQAEAVIAGMGGHVGLEAELHDHMGTVYYTDGKYDLAMELQGRSLAEHQRKGAGGLELAVVHHNLAMVYEMLGRYDAAEIHLRVALALFETRLDARHPSALSTRRFLAWILGRRGQFAAAAAEQERILAATAEVSGEQSADTAGTAFELSFSLYRVERFDDAVAAAQRAVDIYAHLADPSFAADAGLARITGALAMEGLGRADEAIARSDEAVADMARTLGPDHPSVAVGRLNLAQLLVRAAKPKRAVDELLRALPVLEKTRGPQHPFVAIARIHLGDAYLALLRADAARTEYERALGMTESAVDADEPAALALAGLGRVALAQHDPRRAQASLDKSLERMRRNPGADPLDVAHVEFALAQAWWGLGERARAKTLAEGARDAFAHRGARGASGRAAVSAWLAGR